MIYSRITDGGTRRFDPLGSTFAEWAPRTESPEWNDYLSALAAAADHRAAELGRDITDQPPAWAVETLGPVPDELTDRDVWQERAGVIAAYRELRGEDDPVEALGPAPKPGQVEHYAAYRAAWRALGRPEVDQATHEMSDGQLRMRVRAWQREQAWGPRYVGHELVGTRQTASHHQQTATLRSAEVAAAPDPAERPRLRREAAESAALADTLEQRATQLQQLDDARAVFLAHTAGTRAAAEEAEALLADRHAADAEPEQRVTAEEWIAAHHTATAEDERHRTITEDDIADDADQDLRADVDDADGLEAAPVDLREVAATEPRQAQEDVVRVPSAEEVSDTLARAQRSLAEVRARDEADQRAEAEHRAAELARWHDDDLVEQRDAVDGDVLDVGINEPGYELDRT